MQHPQHHEISEFAHTKEINKMYAFVTIQHIGVAIIGIFVPIYLYTLGFTIQQILLYFFLYEFIITLITVPSAWLVQKMCVKVTFITTFPFRVLFFFLLLAVPAHPWVFWILPLVLAIRFGPYNLAWHVNFIEHAKQTGNRLASMHILISIASFMSPYIGALIISRLGFDSVVWVTVVLLAIALIPLFGSKDTCVEKKLDIIKVKEYLFKLSNLNLNLSYLGYAVEAAIGRVLWPLFLFIFLKTYESVGLITSGSLFLTLIVIYTVGKKVDNMDKRKLIKKGTHFYFISWIARGLSVTPALVVFSNIFKELAWKFLVVPWGSYFYDIAKKKHKFEFIVARELVFHAPRILVYPLIIILFDFLPSIWAFTISFAIAASMSLLIANINKYSFK